MKDLKLGIQSHDLETYSNDLALVDEIDAVRQHLQIRLWLFAFEWFLDTRLGLRYFEDILVKNPNVPNIESLIKATILGTDHVNKLLSFSLNYEASTREVTVDFSVDTDYGELDTSNLNLGV